MTRFSLNFNFSCQIKSLFIFSILTRFSLNFKFFWSYTKTDRVVKKWAFSNFQAQFLSYFSRYISRADFWREELFRGSFKTVSLKIWSNKISHLPTPSSLTMDAMLRWCKSLILLVCIISLLSQKVFWYSILFVLSNPRGAFYTGSRYSREDFIGTLIFVRNTKKIPLTEKFKAWKRENDIVVISCFWIRIESLYAIWAF